MKTFFKIGLISSVFTIALFLISCNKEYYDINDIKYSVETPDTIYLDSAVTIKGNINQPLDIKVYFQDLNDHNLIGQLKPYTDSITWTPTNIEEGYYVFCLRVDFKTKKGGGGGIVDRKGFFIKNRVKDQ